MEGEGTRRRMSNINDPYQLRPEEVIDSAKTFLDTLKRIGPGMILAASIVGSGELIATTTLGAKVGYAALWIIMMMLPVIGIGAVYLRHRQLPKDIQPSRWVTIGLWVATALIVWLMGYSVIEAVRNML